MACQLHQGTNKVFFFLISQIESSPVSALGVLRAQNVLYGHHDWGEQTVEDVDGGN